MLKPGTQSTCYEKNMLMIVVQSKFLLSGIADFASDIEITLKKAIILRCISIINRVIKWWLIGMILVCMCMIFTQDKRFPHFYSMQHYHLECIVIFKHVQAWRSMIDSNGISRLTIIFFELKNFWFKTI